MYKVLKMYAIWRIYTQSVRPITHAFKFLYMDVTKALAVKAIERKVRISPENLASSVIFGLFKPSTNLISINLV